MARGKPTWVAGPPGVPLPHPPLPAITLITLAGVILRIRQFIPSATYRSPDGSTAMLRGAPTLLPPSTDGSNVPSPTKTATSKAGVAAAAGEGIANRVAPRSPATAVRKRILGMVPRLVQ